jgi:glycosyltransferase involved in cell wall biosynthesis
VSTHVSVVIPAYQAEALVADAIRSVLAQTTEASEIVVVDDGSTDDTCAVIEAFGPAVRLIRTAHAGSGAARNTGVAASTQSLVALLDADDIWEPTKLERQVAELDDEVVSAVFCWAQNTTVSGPLGSPMPAPLPSALLARRETFDQIGPFDESLTVTDWAEWYMRMVEGGVVTRVVDAVLVQRRVHGNNLGIQRRGEVATYARVIKASLDRRRAGAELQ